MSGRIAKDFISYLPARVIPPIFSLLAIPVFTRLLAEEEYGSYLIALTTLTLIGSLCASWLGSMVVRFRPAMDPEYLAKVCLPLVLLSMAAGGLAWAATAFAQWTPYQSLRYLLPGLVWIAAFTQFEYLSAWLRADNRSAAYTLAMCSRSFGSLLVPLPLLFLGYGKGEAILWSAAATMIIAAVLLRLRPSQPPEPNATPAETPSVTRVSLLRYGMPAALTNFALVGLSLADRFIIDAFLGPNAVAIYGANYDIAEKSVFFVNAMLLLSSTVMTVQIFESDGEHAAAGFLSELLRVYLVLVMPIVTIAAVLAPEVSKLILPPSYAPGAAVLPWIIVSAAFVGIMHRYSLVLSLHKRTDLLMWSTFAALLVKIAAAFILVPKLGIMGAAASTVLGYASWLGFVLLAVRRFMTPRFPWLTLARTLLVGCVAAALSLVVLRLNVASVFLIGIGAIGIYVIGLVGTGETSVSEFRSLGKLVVRRK